jgi:hypothetical protein
MAISRMQQPRQMYGLGSIVKKAVRGVKKVAKSPLGKAAIAGAIGFGIPGTSIGGLFGRAGFGGAATGLLGKQGIAASLPSLFGRSLAAGVQGPTQQGIFGKLASGFGNLSTGQKIFTGLGATALAAPFLANAFGKDDEPEEVGEVMDVANIRNRARNFYSGEGDAGAGLAFMPKKKYVSQNFYAADGGRANFAMGGDTDDEEEFIRSGAGQRYRPAQTFLNMGGDAGNAQAEQMLMAEFVKYKNKGGDLSFEQFVKAVMQQQEQSQGMEQPMMAANGGPVPDSTVPGYTTPAGYNKFDYRSGGVRVNAAEGGIMDAEAAEMIDMGGQEKDYRDEGGFVAMGGEERADDVPARLSKNEFVFTADAVRNAGGGDIDRGSEVMQNLMDNLEQGGQVSEDSQGIGGGEEMMMSEEMIEEPNGAQAMYEQQQALQSRMA